MFGSESSGDHDRVQYFRDASKGHEEDDELGAFLGAAVAVVAETVPDSIRIKEDRIAHLQPKNWLLSKLSKKLRLGGDDRRLSVALIADDTHEYSFSQTGLDLANPTIDDWSGDNRSTRILDGTREHDGFARAALLSQLVKVVDDHVQQYAPALVLGPTHPAEDGGTVGAGLVYDDAAHGPYNGLLESVFTTNPADTNGSGLEGTPFGLLGLRHDAHWELEDGQHHGRIRFEGDELDGYSEPAGWPYKFKASLRHDASVANDNSANKHESGQFRPYYEATFFTPEIPPPPITDGPGVPVYPPDDPGVPVPGGGTGVTLALPLMDPEAPNTPPTDDGFGYLGLAENADGNVQIYVARGGATDWVDLCAQCCDGCGGGTTTFEWGGDGSDGTVTITDGAAVTGTGITWDGGSGFTLDKSYMTSASSFTLGVGAILQTGGFGIYSKGTVTINGTVSRDGFTTAGAGAGGLAASVLGRGNLGTSSDGAAGRTTTGNGQPGTAVVGGGGIGGVGGTAPTRTGGTATGSTEPASVYTPWRALAAWLNHGLVWDQAVGLKIQGGAGGNSGGNNTGAGTVSGPGGGGGGVVLIVGKDVVIGSTGLISAKGGAGGAASGAGNAGGGGGGGGGLVVIVCSTLTVNGVAITDGVVSSTYLDVSGGAGGAGVGSGGTGGTGGTGKYLVIYV